MDDFDKELERMKPQLMYEATALYEMNGLTPAQLYEKLWQMEDRLEKIAGLCSTLNH